jgi:beta-N-acetylhexosaminidase
MVDVGGKHLTLEDRELLAHPLVGSVILFSRNYDNPVQLAQLVSEIHAVRTPALLVAVDHEGGRVQRFRTGFTALPPVRSIGHQYDINRGEGLELARQMGWLMAAELLAYGIDFSFAPCVDLDYGVSEIIGDRAFHARSAAVGELAVAYMHGMRDAGMAATAKHFPGHGIVVADSHVALPVDRRELSDMEPDLAPYRLLIANGLPAVMVAHVLYTSVDSVPASFSRRWIGGVLRDEMRFSGVVFADDLSMLGAESVGNVVERAERALKAGCDVLPVCNSRASVIKVLDELAITADPASQLRLVRMRGRRHPGPEALRASAVWAESQQWLARATATPELKLEAGGS